MKTTFLLFLLAFSTISFAQEAVATQYQKAETLLEEGNFSDAYQIYKKIEPECKESDSLYPYILWFYTVTATQLEKQEFAKEKWQSVLDYALETLTILEKGENHFDDGYSARKYWMYKDIIVSYFGLGQLDNAKKYQEKLYAAYKDKKLPEGIDQYYNFEFFKWKGNNVWGYEFYPELGDPETKGSFSKIVYYVYSTNVDGTDKDQLYRLHVLKFHKFDNEVDFDYVLTKRLETATGEKSGTLYAYTYSKDFDYKVVMADIREVLNGNYEGRKK